MMNFLKFLRPKKVYIVSSFVEYDNGAKMTQIEKIFYSLEEAEKTKNQFDTWKYDSVNSSMRNVIAGLKIKKIVFGISQYEIE